MEINEANLSSLAVYLSQTLNPDINIRRPAEKFLESIEANKNYPLLLLQLVDSSDVDITLRIAAAVVFKNYVKRNWGVEGESCTDKIHPEDRQSVKTVIVNLMLKSPENIQKQLSVAVSTIGSYDFPSQWENLIDEMVEKFASGNFHVINGVLQTAHSLFKKYRNSFKSEKLWREIKFVLDKFAKPLTDLMTATTELTKTVTDIETLKTVVSSLIMISKIFYLLNYQDLPEFFEDNMKTWFEHFSYLLQYDRKELHTAEDEEAGLLERLRGQICDNISLYSEKYDEEFAPFLPEFVTVVWTLLVNTGRQPKYDHLVSYALGFLKNVAERRRHTDLFKDPNVLNEICNKVIIPNMEFRASDEELFEDNPEEYIRRDIEGSDVYTRRRAACDLVRSLTEQFEPIIMGIFINYIQAMISQYVSNPIQHWRSKDAACYLITSMVTKGQTVKHGVTQTSQLVDLVEFANSSIFPELKKPDVNELPVIKADAIKYIMVFRSVLPPSVVKFSLPYLIKHLGASNPVVHTYAATAIEKILALRTSENLAIVTQGDLKPLSQSLLTNLFNLLDQPISSENEYVMKCIMRSFVTLQEDGIPFLSTAVGQLTNKLNIISKNPSKPHFNHYLFETIGFSIKIVCKVSPEAVRNFEELLFPPFQVIMQQDVAEFIPYVFQLLSTMLELQPRIKGPGGEGQIPGSYMALLPLLLAPPLWERPGYVKPLVRLLQAFIALAPSQVIQDNRLNGILGVFQKLIASKNNDHEGFYLIQHLIQFISREHLKPSIKPIFMLIFKRLQSSKTAKLMQSIIVFFNYFASVYSAEDLVELIDSIQPGLFGMVIEKIFLPDVQKVSGVVERKIVAVGLIKLLCETSSVPSGQYSHFWIPLLTCLIALFELPEDTSRPDDDFFVDVEDVPGYSPAYSQLSSVQKPTFDPLLDVTNPKLYLAQCLSKLTIGKPGAFGPLIATMGEVERSHLMGYLAAANTSIS